MEIVNESIKDYQAEVKEEAYWAMDCARAGDWAGVWEVAKANRGLLLGVVVREYN